MSSTISPVTSPPPLVTTGGFLNRDGLPSQSSTSQLAPTPQTSSSIPQLASARYVRQFRAFLDHQRELFNEERALWQIERSELLDHIVQLEESLRQARNISSSQTSPTGTSLSGRSFSNLSAASRSGNVGGIGDEFWRGAGGKSDAQPTRVFSSVSTEGCVLLGVSHTYRNTKSFSDSGNAMLMISSVANVSQAYRKTYLHRNQQLRLLAPSSNQAFQDRGFAKSRILVAHSMVSTSDRTVVHHRLQPLV